MTKRLFEWGTTSEKVKTMLAWAILSFILPGMYTVYRWWSWVFTDYPSYYYLDRGWLGAITTVNFGMMIWLGTLLLIVYMLRDHYRNRREVIREVDEVIEPEEPRPSLLMKFMKEKPPEHDEDYHAQLEEREMTERELIQYLKDNPPGSLQDCDMMLNQVQDSKTAKLMLLNYRKKLEAQQEKLPVKEQKRVFDLTDA